MTQTITIKEIYDRFLIPPHLQKHMLQVTSIGKIICDNWKYPSIQRFKSSIISALLMHDLGNIMKFDISALFANKDGREFPREQIEKWRQIQEQFALKYNNSDTDVVTNLMIKELKLEDEAQIINLLNQMHLDLLTDPTNCSLASLIVAYADCRVGPEKVMSAEERTQDLARRYHYRDANWADPKYSTYRINIIQKIEAELQKNLLIDIKSINQADCDQNLEELAAWELPVHI